MGKLFPKFKEKIVYIDTLKDPYSSESIARKLLCKQVSKPVIKKITGLNLEIIDELGNKDVSLMNHVCRILDEALDAGIDYPDLDVSLWKENESGHIYDILAYVLGVTPEQIESFDYGNR